MSQLPDTASDDDIEVLSIEDDFEDDNYDFDDDADIDLDSQSDEDGTDIYGPGYTDELMDIGSEPKKAYMVRYGVLSASDVNERQAKTIGKVASILQVEPSQAASLLHVFRWHPDSLVERYMEDSDKVLGLAGLSTTLEPSIMASAEPSWTCSICCEESTNDSPLQVFALPCRHFACTNCYEYYLRQKISEEGQSRDIPCILGGKQCNLKFDQDSIHKIVSPGIFAKFWKNQIEAFVQENEQLKWCSAPECEYAIECSVRKDELNQVVPSVTCYNKHSFCFGCGEEEHQPTLCVLASKWRKKCADDSETANWISAHTKDCPKCKAIIEKNGGCNHMTCKKCKFEFCWVCLGDWVKHGQSFYHCGRFEQDEDVSTQRQKSRQELERYLHYYQRYANHQQSLKLDEETYIQLDAKMKAMQEIKGLTWIEAQYLKESFETLRECRHTLTWSYAFAFYLKPSNQTTIFEDNQRDLELATENLSELFEKPVEDVADKNIRMEMINKRAYVASRREVILEFAAKELSEKAWDFVIPI